MSSPTFCFLTLPEYPMCPAPDHPYLLSPVTDDPDGSVLDLSLKKRPRFDSSEDAFFPSPARKATTATDSSGEESCPSQDEYQSEPSNAFLIRPDGVGTGTYKKHLLKRYCKCLVFWFCRLVPVVPCTCRGRN